MIIRGIQKGGCQRVRVDCNPDRPIRIFENRVINIEKILAVITIIIKKFNAL